MGKTWEEQKEAGRRGRRLRGPRRGDEAAAGRRGTSRQRGASGRTPRERKCRRGTGGKESNRSDNASAGTSTLTHTRTHSSPQPPARERAYKARPLPHRAALAHAGADRQLGPSALPRVPRIYIHIYMYAHTCPRAGAPTDTDARPPRGAPLRAAAARTPHARTHTPAHTRGHVCTRTAAHAERAAARPPAPWSSRPPAHSLTHSPPAGLPRHAGPGPRVSSAAGASRSPLHPAPPALLAPCRRGPFKC